MVLNTSKNAKSPRSKKEAEQDKMKAGKKRAMEESESDEMDDDDIDMETLKKLSKKMKATEEDIEGDSEDEGSDDEVDSEGASDDDEEEDSDDEELDEEDDDDEESEEEEKPVKTTIKNQPKQAAQPVKGKQPAQTNGVAAPEKPTTTTVNGNAVLICNLDKNFNKESLKTFLSTKAGVQAENCFVSMKPSAILTTKTKQDAEKIMNACQHVLYQGNQLQISTIASGVVSQSQPTVTKNIEEIEPSKSMLVYTLAGNINADEVKKLCPKAIECNKGHSGVFLSFLKEEDCRESFLHLAKLGKILEVKIMVKYVKNNTASVVFTGKETRLMLYNLPYEATKQSVQELAPKATFVHFNPCSWGSWIVEFASTKDCKEAGERLTNYQVKERPIRVNYATSDAWDIKFNAKSSVNNAKELFNQQFPDMSDFHVGTSVYKNKRAPQFILTFKNREAWQRALAKALELRSIGGVQIYLLNQGKPRSEFVDKKAKQQKPVPQKMKEESEEEKEDDDEEESMDDDGADSDEDVAPAKKSPQRGGAKFNARGRGGGKFRGGRGGSFPQQRGRGGNFRGRGRGGK